MIALEHANVTSHFCLFQNVDASATWNSGKRNAGALPCTWMNLPEQKEKRVRCVHKPSQLRKHFRKTIPQWLVAAINGNECQVRQATICAVRTLNRHAQKPIREEKRRRWSQWQWPLTFNRSLNSLCTVFSKTIQWLTVVEHIIYTQKVPCFQL